MTVTWTCSEHRTQEPPRGSQDPACRKSLECVAMVEQAQLPTPAPPGTSWLLAGLHCLPII
ncbi:hypothetical protein E2C01_017650 [Portunus trituberculatus]|uniref:Uncharacterized protein n=1 Tax=Portunus trituberculatus TaxID=210409 RepID=A0A5B7DUE5_PORTR|nr:hypothetical protein [Portunus trituberculatus]